MSLQELFVFRALKPGEIFRLSRTPQKAAWTLGERPLHVGPDPQLETLCVVRIDPPRASLRCRNTSLQQRCIGRIP